MVKYCDLVFWLHVEIRQYVMGASGTGTKCVCVSTCVWVCVTACHCVSLLFHQINPPHYIPLVEVIPAPWTDKGVVKATVDLMKELGQKPISAKKEVNGFILNRLQYALIMEAWRLVEVGDRVG